MIIVKIGGGKEINIRGIIQDLVRIKRKVIIVHGANAYRNEIANQLKIDIRSITSVLGYSSVLSDQNVIDLQMMVYAGLRNKRIVEICQQEGINGVGLSGLDGRVIEGIRNKGIRVIEGGKKRLIRDFSGKAKRINHELLNILLDNGYTPILSVPIIDEQGFALNSENDDIVALLQNNFQVKEVVQLIETKGFLEDMNHPKSIISQMNRADIEIKLIQTKGRIKRKLHSLKKLMDGNQNLKVYIGDGRVSNPIMDALEGKGTVISC